MLDKTNNENYFSLNNLGELADFNEHIAFAEKMLNKYKWEPNARETITSLLQQIRSKQEDKLLNLSVIGEFSSGKSTFINAMLRDELLSSSALQGTTVASTVIEPADWFGIVLEYSSGFRQTHEYDGLGSLKENLESFTTIPHVARKLETVKVYLPSEHLKKGFRIIDTPGTNALEQWHEEITVRTLHDVSDASIILVDATKPLPESLCSFVMGNLEDILNQCVFVVTKMDLLREKEREQMLSYIRAKLKNTFGLEYPKVLPYASIDVIDSLENGERSELAEMSFQSEAEIFSRMTRQRASLQAKKLISLIDYMYGYIGKEMEGISKDSEAELERLMRSKQADLSSFISTQKRERTAAFDSAVKDKRTEIVDELYSFSEVAQRKITNKVTSFSQIDGLKSFINDKLTAACSEEAATITKAVENGRQPIYDCFQDQMLLFWENFEELFKNLDILQVDLSKDDFDKQELAPMKTANLSELNSYLERQSKTENFFSIGGLAAGAAIGTTVMPVIGTVIGGFIGLMASSAVGPKIEKVQANTLEKLRLPLKNYFEDVVKMSISSLDSYINGMSTGISDEIDRYLGKYNDTVEKKIKEERKQQDKAEKKLADIRKDMKDIENRKFRLSSVSEHINSLTGKER